MYYILKLMQFVLKNIPRKAGYFIFDILFLCNLLLPSKRKNTLKINLANVLGRKAPDSMVREVYKCYARYYFDLYQDKDKIFPYVTITPRFQSSYDNSKELLKKNKGLIVLSLHMGSWDFAASYFAKMYPGRANVVVERLSPAVFKWFTETRQNCGIKIIAADDIKSMLRALKDSEVLLMVADRDLDKKGYQLDFFGKKAYIPSGPARLALTCGTPMMFGTMTRDKADPLKFIPFYDPEVLNGEALERTEENSLKLTRQIIVLMEKYVAEYPGQWCMLQDVWVEEKSKVKSQN
jgi:lauroyl/myristoyl acyltransferase